MPKAYKMRYRIHVAVHAWLGKRNGLGTLADAQVSWCDSIVHV